MLLICLVVKLRGGFDIRHYFRYSILSLMKNVIVIAQIAVSVLLVVIILLQNRGAGVSAIFGGTGGAYRTKRGLERGLHILTILLAVLFVAVGVLNLVISS